MARQFPQVDTRFGAPMGRATWPLKGDIPPRSLSLFRVRIDAGGYDDGGAYWGLGAPLYCLRGSGDDWDVRGFVRAPSRAHAALALCVPHSALKRGI